MCVYVSVDYAILQYDAILSAKGQYKQMIYFLLDGASKLSS